MEDENKDYSDTKLSLNTIYNMDCIEGMKLIPDWSVDLICVDPPYWISFWNNDRDKIKDFKEFTNQRVEQCFRVLRQWWSFYWFMARSNVCDFKNILDQYWTIRNWITRERTKWRWSSKNFKSTKEEILYYVKGKWETRNEQKMLKKHVFPYMKDWKPRWWFTNEEWDKCRRTWIGNVRHYTTPFFKMEENTAHPTQKPELMIERIILTSSNEWDVVLDPFMWSWTTAKVAKDNNRNYIWFELDEWYRNIANKRIQDRLSENSLF